MAVRHGERAPSHAESRAASVIPLRYSHLMLIRLYNTLTKSLEEFRPLQAGGEVSFYSCGPTVYDDAHIGNFRSFLNADVLRRALEQKLASPP